MLKDKLEEAAFYQHDSDRAVGIAWAAIVENRLTAVLKATLRNDKDAFHELFRSGGAIGNFRTKISLAYLMGLIEKDIHKELLIINKIRNSFAHEVGTISFETQPVTDYLRTSKIIETYKLLRDKLKTKETKNSDLIEKIEFFILEDALSDFRSKYYLCIRYLINKLVLLEKMLMDARNNDIPIIEDA